MRKRQIIFALAMMLPLFACEREKREFHQPPPSTSAGDTGVQQSPLTPGGQEPLQPGQTEASRNANSGPYSENAYAVAEGKRLFDQYNCSGCHAHGGGGIGPPLMDANWIYGSQPQNIHDTILEGRPNGMPSFRGKIPEFQVWEIVAYVRSMSGQLRMDVAPGRSDHMSYKKPEQSGPKENPTQR
jgi:cytochrome c oxidase cbb3-type subunit 3